MRENILFKILTSLIIIFTAFSSSSLYAEGSFRAMYLSDKEISYLGSLREVKMCVDPSWAPYEWIDSDGRYMGMGADFMSLLSKRLGVPFVLIPTESWQESIKFAESSSCDILPLLNETEERLEYLNFTSPYLINPSVIVTRKDAQVINSIKDLRGKTVSLPKDFHAEMFLKKQYPEIRLKLVKDETISLTLLSEGKVDAVVSSLITASLIIQQEKLDNLRIWGHFDFEDSFRIGIIRGKPELFTILQKAVLSFTKEEKEIIFQRWNPIAEKSRIDRVLLFRVVLFGLLLILMAIAWGVHSRRTNRKLRSLNEELQAAKEELEKSNSKLEITSRTDRLTGIANRYGIEDFFKRQLYRAKRGHPFSVAIGDIDHFKNVNDDYGHSKGDCVLAELSKIFQTSIREVDLVGRWGGEEFMIIYEDMEENEDLFSVVDRIRKKVEVYDFGINRAITISFGVASFLSGERIDDLIFRADEALYEAKKTGRNKVVLADNFNKI